MAEAVSRHVSSGEAVAFWVTMGFLIAFTVAVLVVLGVVVYRAYWRRS